MKKAIALLIALILIVISVASCGGGGGGTDTPMTRKDGDKTAAEGDETTQGGAQGIVEDQPISLEALLQYCESGDTSVFTPHKLTAAEQDKLRRSVEAQGGTVEFSQNGDITVRGVGTSWFTIRIDGSVEGVDDDGNPFGFSNAGTWPDSELGKAIPEAGLEIQSSIGDDENVVITFKNAGYDEMKAYAAKVKAAGFTENESETDMPDSGIYVFSAENADGLTVSVMYMASQNSAMVSVEKRSGADDTGDDPFYPGYQGSEAELPSEFAFLAGGVTDGLAVYDYDGYYSIEKKSGAATLEEAKKFASLCEENGFAKMTGTEYANPDGLDAFFAVYSKDNLEITISFNIIEDTPFFVDLKKAESGGQDIPAGTDEWPSSGFLSLIPKPDFGTGFTIGDNDEYQTTVMVTGATAEDYAAYVQKVMAAGFTVDADYEDDDDVLFYEAADGKGHAMYVQFVYGIFAIGVGLAD
ncbi:MAG: hypothetical protein J5830_01285 [Clostridia bacterium]|nr:hypothetical protein [Clostridia bacterium]